MQLNFCGANTRDGGGDGPALRARETGDNVGETCCGAGVNPALPVESRDEENGHDVCE